MDDQRPANPYSPNWVPKVMGAVPYLGMIFHLVDSLFIFREDRRCLHDRIAGTRVVRQQR